MFSFFSKYFTNLFKNKTDKELHLLFERYVKIVVDCSKALEQLFAGPPEERAVHIQRIIRFKNEGDLLKRQMNEKLDQTFIISWIDKSEATQLINDLDGCLRAMRRVAKHTQIYQVRTIRPQVQSLISCIVRMALEIPGMVDDLKNSRFDRITSRNPEIGNLETEADELRSIAVGMLWQEDGADALTVIKWERIFQGLERVTDHERDIADTLLSIARAAL